MKCQCVHTFGEGLIAEDRADLQPQGTEVIVEVIAAGVCHTDLHMRSGGVDLGHGRRLSYAERGIKLPLTLGHETVGRVVAAGPDAGHIDMSKNYLIFPWCGCGACDTCRAGDENLCAAPRFLGLHVDGGYATRMRIAHPRYLFDIGDMAPEQAAPLACSGLTTFGALKKVGPLTGDLPPVLIGAGGLGLMCLQLMKAMKLPAPVVVDIDPAKRQAALAAGARAVVDPSGEGAVARVTEAVGGMPLAVLDFVGAEATAALAFDVLGKGGTMVNVGLYGGAAPWALPMITLKTATIKGSYVGSLNELAELMQIARSGALDPIPVTTYPLDQADAVLNDLEAGKIIGRALLIPA